MVGWTINGIMNGALLKDVSIIIRRNKLINGDLGYCCACRG